MKFSVFLVLKLTACLAIPLPGIQLPQDNFHEQQTSNEQQDLRVESLHGLAHSLSLTGNKFDDGVLSSSETSNPIQDVLRLIYGDDTHLKGSAVPLEGLKLTNQNLSNHDVTANGWFSLHQLSGIKSEETKGHTEYISGVSLQDKGQSSDNDRDRQGSGSTAQSSRLSVSQSPSPPRIVIHKNGDSSKIVHKYNKPPIQESSLHQTSETDSINNGSPNENDLPKPTESVQQNNLAHGSQMHANPASMTRGGAISRNEHIPLTSNPDYLGESFDPNAVNNQQQMFSPGQYMQAMVPQTGSDPNNARYRVSYNADEVNQGISQDRLTMSLHVPPWMSNVQRPSFDPDKVNSATFNFRPLPILPQMGAEVGANFQTSFDPSKINSVIGGFQPNALRINGQPKYDADEVNRALLAADQPYLPWSMENGKTDSNRVNLPTNPNQKGYTLAPDQQQQGESTESVSQGKEHQTAHGISQMQFGSFVPGTLYPGENNPKAGQLKAPLLNSAGRQVDGNGGASLYDFDKSPHGFDPNNINDAQAAFNPDAMMHSLIAGHSNFKRDINNTDNNYTFPSPSPTLPSTTFNIKPIETSQHPENAHTSEINPVRGETGNSYISAPSTTQDQTGFVPGQLAPGFGNYVFDPNVINQAAFGGRDPGGVGGTLGVGNMGVNGQENVGMGANAFAGGGQQVNASPLMHQGHIVNTNDTNENMNPYGNGFGMDARFDPVAVNNQAMNYNYADMIGENVGLGVQGDNNMGGGGFGGNGFDPNNINRVFGEAGTNNSTDGHNNMDSFLNAASGSFGGNTEYGAFFDPSKVNTATFDPDSLNNAQMNFDPINMLLNNPGMTKDILKAATFDANKVNAAQMQFNPINMLINNPGMNKDVLNSITFDPNKINAEQNAFNPLTMFGNLLTPNTTANGNNLVNVLFNPFGNAANPANEKTTGPNSSPERNLSGIDSGSMGSETTTVTTTSTQESSIMPTMSGWFSMVTSPSTTQEVTTVNSTNSN